jgi:hypothetical protein
MLHAVDCHSLQSSHEHSAPRTQCFLRVSVDMTKPPTFLAEVLRFGTTPTLD